MMTEAFKTIFLYLLAVAPTLAVMIYIYMMDKHEHEPFHVLFKTFAWGCVSVVPALAMQTGANLLGYNQYTVPLGVFGYAFFIVAFSEELSKYIFLRLYPFRHKDFNEPFDGIMYSIMIGMGFATVENVIYVLHQASMQESVIAGVARIFTAVPAHAGFAIVMGYYVGMAKFRPGRRLGLLIMGLLGAVILHGFYDYFLIQQSSILLSIGAFLSLSTAIALSLKAIRVHSNNSPFRVKDPIPSDEPV
jgi:RsiW-degrading membrane proteinase PrsW (M82 family)